MAAIRRDRMSFGMAEMPTKDRPALSPFRPALRVLLGPIARPIPCARLGRAEGRRILVRTWELYPTHLTAVDGTARLGVGPSAPVRDFRWQVNPARQRAPLQHDAAVAAPP